MSSFLSDLRLGARVLRKTPGFTLAAVLTLGLGIGGNVAMLSVANALFLRPVPLVEAPGELAWILGTERQTGRTHSLSYPDARDLDAMRDVFTGVLAEARLDVNFAGEGAPIRVPGVLVSANYFPVLGVRPALGRTFLPEEGKTPGTHPVVVISDGLWRKEFGGDPSTVGRSVTINSHRFTIVGVLPAGFVGTAVGERSPDLYLPAMMVEQAAPEYAGVLEARSSFLFSLIGRLRPGVSVERATVAAQAVAAARRADRGPQDPVTTFRLQRMVGSMHPSDRAEGLSLGALGLAIAGIVLLIACANLAALLLGRSTGRRREMAVRLALGAGRRRLVRQLLTESLLMSLLGAGAGVVLSAWTTSAVLTALSVPLQLDVTPDLRVVLAAVALAAGAAVVFGMAPALAASRTQISPALTDGGAATGMPLPRRRLQRAFVVAQIALSLMLLASSTLLLRSMRAAATADAGFDTSSRVLSLSFDLAAQGYSEAQVRQMSDLLLERVSSLPGVQSATMAGLVPLGGVLWGTNAQVEDAESAAPRPSGLIFMNPVRPHFFRTIGMRLIAGRDFLGQDDQAAPGVVIVSETVARNSWPGQSPIGRRLRLGGEKAPWLTVVGVVGDMVDGPGERPRPFIYVPMLQQQNRRLANALLVRGAGPSGALVSAVTAEVRRLDPTLPVFHVATMEDIARERLLPRKAGSTIVAAFGIMALGLAALGLYGVLSYVVMQRRREIGIRMALGAGHRAIVRMVLREGMRLALAGLAAGLALAAAATTLLASMFPVIGGFDPAALAVPAAVVIAIVLAATSLPALRAARLDPVTTLRNE